MGKLLNLSKRVGIRVDLHPRSAIMATYSSANLRPHRGERRDGGWVFTLDGSFEVGGWHVGDADDLCALMFGDTSGIGGLFLRNEGPPFFI